MGQLRHSTVNQGNRTILRMMFSSCINWFTLAHFYFSYSGLAYYTFFIRKHICAKLNTEFIKKNLLFLTKDVVCVIRWGANEFCWIFALWLALDLVECLVTCTCYRVRYCLESSLSARDIGPLIIVSANFSGPGAHYFQRDQLFQTETYLWMSRPFIISKERPYVYF